MCDKTYIEFTLNRGYFKFIQKIILSYTLYKKNCYLCKVIFVI